MGLVDDHRTSYEIMREYNMKDYDKRRKELLEQEQQWVKEWHKDDDKKQAEAADYLNAFSSAIDRLSAICSKLEELQPTIHQTIVNNYYFVEPNDDQMKKIIDIIKENNSGKI